VALRRQLPAGRGGNAGEPSLRIISGPRQDRPPPRFDFPTLAGSRRTKTVLANWGHLTNTEILGRLEVLAQKNGAPRNSIRTHFTTRRQLFSISVAGIVDSLPSGHTENGNCSLTLGISHGVSASAKGSMVKLANGKKLFRAAIVVRAFERGPS